MDFGNLNNSQFQNTKIIEVPKYLFEMKTDLETLTEDELGRQRSIKVIPAAQKRRSPKNKNRNKSDVGVNFIAPDGGWGWLVVIAAAISVLVTLAVLQQIGEIMRRRFEAFGINSSQMTTILRLQEVAATCTALLNGEIFRRFTFREISLAGAIFTFLGLALTAFADSFSLYLMTLSIMCGIGKSLIFSSSYIAVNTYFKENRRSAIACMCSIVGLGPILLPYLTTFLMDEYGLAWAVIFYAMLSLHNFAASLVYQPVEFHAVKQRDFELTEIRPMNFVFGSGHIEKLCALENSTNSNNDLNLHRFSTSTVYPLRVPKNSFASFEPLSRSIPKIILPDEREYLESPQDIPELPAIDNKNRAILLRISSFLDLDLLRDFSYVNLALGLALIHVVEINYGFLMPFILKDFGCNESQMTIALSLLALCDILMKMSIPFITRNFKFSNKVVLLYALMGMCIGRTILVFNRNFLVVLICFGWMGLCTAIRIVFWMLILPSYMPLKRLPAAIGLQQVATGVFVLIFGEFRGLIEDASNYSLVLLCMNTVYLFIIFAWLGEDYLRGKKILSTPSTKN